VSLPPLSPADFPAFFEAVLGHPPFPWQARLVREIADRDRWPDLLDLPTGSGKTAAIDVAVFHLALAADRGEDRTAAMRIAFVVDRRLVVDDAFLRAQKLAAALAAPDAAPVVRAVAARLGHFAGPGGPPLAVARLRGGTPREDDWAETPCQPTVVCSTVDQVGSRLLFRGYGVSDRMLPVHAGLLGSDALILLDEAHLAEPFRQTLQAIASVEAIHGADRRPVRSALLTATPGAAADGEWRFGLDEDDRATERLAGRLTAAKPATLVEVAEKDREATIAAHACGMVARLMTNGVAGPVVAVVVNRVARARAVFELLRGDLGETADILLLIGRSRPVDRDVIAGELVPIRTGSDARPVRSMIVVATQTIEAGVDIDLDGLVTDAASLDALRQRFGRLNRAGRPIASEGVIVADKADRKPKKGGDPIYGEAIARTLAALFPTGAETVDFGSAALDQRLADAGLTGAAVLPLLVEKPDAPVLMPAHVDLWTRTAPIPATDPDPALFLHGPRAGPAGVQIVWRADVEALIDDEETEKLRALLDLMPPRAAETLELPVWVAKAWLQGGGTDPALGDVAGAPGETGGGTVVRRAFRWRGADDPRSAVIEAGGVKPGDLIVVPSAHGGCDRFGWDPSRTVWTTDVADRAASPDRPLVVRIAPGLVLQSLLDADPSAKLEDVAAGAERIAARVAAALEGLGGNPGQVDVRAALEGTGLPAPLASALDDVGSRNGPRPVFPYGERGDGVVLTGYAPNSPHPRRTASTENDEAGSFVGRRMKLGDHVAAVRATADRFACLAGLPPTVVADIALAAALHDEGKRDPRFQRLLFGGDLFVDETALLAKSAEGRSSRGSWARTGLPAGWRHEAASVERAITDPRLQEAHDRALVLWLVGTHHGWGRPFFDLRNGEEGPHRLGFALPETAAFAPRSAGDDDLRGFDWPGLFVLVKDRHGPWGLARLEAVLRLADHRASEDPSS
jgi:CRISPR-associated endonuclease/helicase Cas3